MLMMLLEFAVEDLGTVFAVEGIKCSSGRIEAKNPNQRAAATCTAGRTDVPFFSHRECAWKDNIVVRASERTSVYAYFQSVGSSC